MIWLFSAGLTVMQLRLRPSMPLFLARKPAVVYQFGWMTHLVFGVWSDVTIVRGHTLEDANDHVSINGFVVPVHDRPVMVRHLARGGHGLERTQRDHVRVPPKAFGFDGSRRGSDCFFHAPRSGR